MSHCIYAIYGAGGHGRETMPLARTTLEETRGRGRSYELVFVDDSLSNSVINGHRVLSYQAFRSAAAVEKYVNVAVADSTTRRALFERCSRDGIEPFDVRASNVCTLDDVILGPGSILAPFVTLTSNIRIGAGFHANTYCSVAHDCVIGDYVTFAPAAKCNGNVVVEDDAYLGAGCVVRQGTPGQPLIIGRGAVVGMGAVVTRNVAPGTTVVGNPARPIERRNGQC